MDERAKSGHVQQVPRKSKYDDWICLFCQNHNYSFRQICTFMGMQAIDVIYRLNNKIAIWIMYTSNR